MGSGNITITAMLVIRIKDILSALYVKNMSTQNINTAQTAERRWMVVLPKSVEIRRKSEIYLIGGKHENNRSNKAVTLAD